MYYIWILIVVNNSSIININSTLEECYNNAVIHHSVYKQDMACVQVKAYEEKTT